MKTDERFSKAVEIIYQAASSPERWSDALQAITDCFDDVGTILLYNRDDGGFSVLTSPGIRSSVEEYGASGWNFRDTRALRSRERGYFVNRDTITDRDVVSEEEISTDPFYSDFLARHGLKYFAAAMVSPDPKIEVAVSVQRAIGKPPFSEDELSLLGKIGVHIEQALRLSVRLMDGDLLTTGLVAAFERMNIGIFALDSLARVLFANSTASALLGDGFELVGDRLEFRQLKNAGDIPASRLIADQSDLSSLIDDHRPVLVERRSTKRPLIAYMMPLHPDNPAAEFLARARALLLVVSMDSADAPDPSVLRDILGLTLGEAKVASLVGTGWAPKTAAAQLGITEETARSVLKRVYSKVGVGRQSELAGLLSRMHINAGK